jgi:predicted double-glycine peptidase
MKLKPSLMAAAAALSLAACGSPVAAPVIQPPAQVAQPASVPSPDGNASSVASEAEPSPAAAPAVSPSASTAPGVTAEHAAAPVASAAPVGPPVTATPAAFRLPPLVYIRQTLNNCGPAAIAEVLHFFGVEQTQGQAQAVLRPDGNSRGMWPYGVPGYVSKLGMSSLMGVGGNPTMLKALVTNGFPVIVSQWVSAADREGHYREIEGFDDNRKVFISTDSYLGPNHEIGYDEFNQIWTGNQRFMVIYPPAKQPLLDAVLVSVNWSKTAAYQADILKIQTRALDPGVPQGFRRGESGLGLAWDNIQLGNFDAARTEIQQATAQGASPTMVSWLNQALASPSSR